MRKILLGASHIAVAENTRAQDDTYVTVQDVVPPTTEAGADLFSELFNLKEESSATDIYLDSLQCNTETKDFVFRDAVLNYVAGFIMRKMKTL